jgi:DNA-binding transcriptional MocR family regulator
MIFLDKESFYQYIYSMIESSTKKPKQMAVSTVKTANLLDCSVSEVEQFLNDFVKEGRLQTAILEEPPNHEIYILP